MSKERHHVPAKIIVKIFDLPKNTAKIVLLEHDEHRKETKYLNSWLPTLYRMKKKGVIYTHRVIKKEDVERYKRAKSD